MNKFLKNFYFLIALVFAVSYFFPSSKEVFFIKNQLNVEKSETEGNTIKTSTGTAQSFYHLYYKLPKKQREEIMKEVVLGAVNKSHLVLEIYDLEQRDREVEIILKNLQRSDTFPDQEELEMITLLITLISTNL